jgi:hypothetical protein
MRLEMKTTTQKMMHSLIFKLLFFLQLDKDKLTWKI